MANQVVGVPQNFTFTLTNSTTAYAAGDRLGTAVITLSNVFTQSHSMFLTSMHVLDISGQSPSFNVLLFQESPTVASADNAALNIADAEMEKCIGSFVFDGTYITTSANSFASKEVNLHLMNKVLSNTNLYLVFETVGTPTFTSTTALRMQINFLNG
jgi:hypothetical protein